MNIPDIIKILANTTDSIKIKKLENDIARMFISPLLFIAAIANFGCYFVLHEDLLRSSINSIILLCSAIGLELLSRKLENEKLKEIFITLLFSFIIAFVWISYYHLVGPGVWIFSITILLVTIFRESKLMSLAITTTMLTVLALTFLTNTDVKDPNNVAYLGQMILIVVMITILLFVRKIIVIRSDLLIKHYYDTLKEKEKFRTTLKSVGDGVITVNQESIIEFINPTAQNLIGLSDNEVVGKQFDTVFNIVNEYTRAKVKSPIGLVFEKKEIVELANHTLLISKNGLETPIEDTAAPIKYANGTISGAVLIFRDIGEKKEKQKYIEHLSYHDQLTGLYNRRFFDEEISRLDVKRNLPISLIYADIDGLKIVNDAFGHKNGDQVIIQTANSFREVFRADDIIARVGGDEFIILLPSTDSQSVKKLIKRLEEKTQKICINEICISVSFGCNTKNDENQSIQEILINAENFMYQNKILNHSSKRNGIIKSIISLLYINSPREKSHSKRVGSICKKIGEAYKLSNDEIEELKTVGELHDIGKISVSEEVLNNPEKLTDEEWIKIRKHPEIGYRLLGSTSEFSKLAESVLSHHERWDGSGYPNGLKGEKIDWKARVIHIADSYDMMTNDKPYGKALPVEKAIEEIKNNAGSQFDPEIAKVFIEDVLKAKF